MARMVTIAEAADALGCNVSNIYQKIKKYDIHTESRSVEQRDVVVRKLNLKHVDLDELLKAGRKSDAK